MCSMLLYDGISGAQPCKRNLEQGIASPLIRDKPYVGPVCEMLFVNSEPKNWVLFFHV